MKFKLYFPTGYKNLNILDDNVDVYVITEDRSVYYATLYTTNNILSIMERNKELWFWAANMIIVKDLTIESICKGVEEILLIEYFESIIEKVGDLQTMFRTSDAYTNLNDWHTDSPQVFSALD